MNFPVSRAVVTALAVSPLLGFAGAAALPLADQDGVPELLRQQQTEADASTPVPQFLQTARPPQAPPAAPGGGAAFWRQAAGFGARAEEPRFAQPGGVGGPRDYSRQPVRDLDRMAPAPGTERGARQPSPAEGDMFIDWGAPAKGGGSNTKPSHPGDGFHYVPCPGGNDDSENDAPSTGPSEPSDEPSTSPSEPSGEPSTSPSEPSTAPSEPSASPSESSTPQSDGSGTYRASGDDGLGGGFGGQNAEPAASRTCERGWFEPAVAPEQQQDSSMTAAEGGRGGGGIGYRDPVRAS